MGGDAAGQVRCVGILTGAPGEPCHRGSDATRAARAAKAESDGSGRDRRLEHAPCAGYSLEDMGVKASGRRHLERRGTRTTSESRRAWPSRRRRRRRPQRPAASPILSRSTPGLPRWQVSANEARGHGGRCSCGIYLKRAMGTPRGASAPTNASSAGGDGGPGSPPHRTPSPVIRPARVQGMSVQPTRAPSSRLCRRRCRTANPRRPRRIP